MATFLVAHGAWSAGWAWKKMRPLLRSRGHELFTPTHTGLGERSHLASADIDLEAHIADIRPGESCERVLEYMDYDRTGMLDAIARQLRRVAGRSLKKEESRAIYREFEEVFPRYTYLER